MPVRALQPSRFLGRRRLDGQDLLYMASDLHLSHQAVQPRKTLTIYRATILAAVHFWMIRMSRFYHPCLILLGMLGVVLRLPVRPGPVSLRLRLAVWTLRLCSILHRYGAIPRNLRQA